MLLTLSECLVLTFYTYGKGKGMRYIREFCVLLMLSEYVASMPSLDARKEEKNVTVQDYFAY